MLNNIMFVAKLLASIGALNWGLIGVFEFNLVTFLFGLTLTTKVIYSLVGIGGLVLLFNLFEKAAKTTVV